MVAVHDLHKPTTLDMIVQFGRKLGNTAIVFLLLVMPYRYFIIQCIIFGGLRILNVDKSCANFSVALWHDQTMSLLAWSGVLVLCIIPEQFVSLFSKRWAHLMPAGGTKLWPSGLRHLRAASGVRKKRVSLDIIKRIQVMF